MFSVALFFHCKELQAHPISVNNSFHFSFPVSIRIQPLYVCKPYLLSNLIPSKDWWSHESVFRNYQLKQWFPQPNPSIILGLNKCFPAHQTLHLLGQTSGSFSTTLKHWKKQQKKHNKPWGNTDIILLPGMIKLCKSPVYQAKLTLRMVNHNIMWLYIPMHDSLWVAIIQCL